MIKVVNIKHLKYDQDIGRADRGEDGYFGNSYHVGIDGDRNECIEKYREYFHRKIGGDLSLLFMNTIAADVKKLTNAHTLDVSLYLFTNAFVAK